MKKYLLLPLLCHSLSILPSEESPNEKPPMTASEIAVNAMNNTIPIDFDVIVDQLNDDGVSKEAKAALLLRLNLAADNTRALFGAFQIAAFQDLLEPKNIGLISLGALGIFGAWHTSKLLREVITHKLLIPPLAQKTNIIPWYSSKKKSEPLTFDDIVLSEDLTQQAQELVTSAQYGAQHDLKLRHFLFYGPPGTGKTLLAQIIADQAGLKYMYFPASKLTQYSEEEGERQINRLFEYASSYPEKLMVIMDEVDGIFQHRDRCPAKILSFQETILSHIGTESEDFMFVGITNRPQDLDDAAMSRYGVKLYVGPPGPEERERLFKLYTTKYFVPHAVRLEDRRPWYKKLLGSRVRFREPLKIAPDITQAVFEDLANRSEGFVGRDISDMLIGVQSQGYYRPDKTITKDMLYRALITKKEQNAAADEYARERKARS